MRNLIDTISNLYEKKIIENQINRINITNFRNFTPNTSIDFKFPLTVFVGKNGTGKSTVMKIIKGSKEPAEVFIETTLETHEIDLAEFSVEINNVEYIYQRKKLNLWTSNKKLNQKLSILDIDTKKVVGAFDKNFLYDSVGQKFNRENQVNYLIKQTKKINQNRLDRSSKKKLLYFNHEQLSALNNILQKNYKSISIMNHRYFNGTWGTTVIFQDDRNYTEYNSGGGEFALAMIIIKVSCTQRESVVLIDEPEIALHPGAQKRLLKWLLEIIIRKKIQIIMCTHSSTIIEHLPKKCIKCFSAVNQTTINIRQDVIASEAFHELEINHFDKKAIIVEDSLARDILLSIIKEEGYNNTFEIQYSSGGASYIKTQIIPTLAKMKFTNYFIFFDGDQFKGDRVDMSDLLEKDKTTETLSKLFLKILDVNSKTINWGIDGNRKKGTSNQDQLNRYIEDYLSYFNHYVDFLPCQIPEDIIFDIHYASNIYPEIERESLNTCKNSKERFQYLAKEMNLDTQTLYTLFISNFIKRKKESSEYNEILTILNKWII